MAKSKESEVIEVGGAQDNGKGGGSCNDLPATKTTPPPRRINSLSEGEIKRRLPWLQEELSKPSKFQEGFRSPDHEADNGRIRMNRPGRKKKPFRRETLGMPRSQRI